MLINNLDITKAIFSHSFILCPMKQWEFFMWELDMMMITGIRYLYGMCIEWLNWFSEVVCNKITSKIWKGKNLKQSVGENNDIHSYTEPTYSIFSDFCTLYNRIRISGLRDAY